MLFKKWEYKYKTLKKEEINSISERFGIPKVISTIILNRKISSSDIEAYLSKSIKNIINPYEFLDMEKAVDRICQAIENKEKIVIYGDYDVDGITSTALLYEFLLSQGANVSYYIPDRKDEGYGINIMAVNKLTKSGTKLLITVDCGITAIGEVEFAKLQGMDVIITDHHTCKERIPTAAQAVINPKREDDSYPFDALAGVGVAFKLMLAVAIKLGLNTTEYFDKYVDLATIGTIADVVSLTGENRIIVNRGLLKLQNPTRPGIRALMEISGTLSKPVTTTTIGFAIAPRMNAAGRISSATTSVELMLEKDYQKALEIARELDNENKQRQEMEKTIFEEALQMISADVNFEKKKVIVLAKEGWHQGVIGIVASRLNDMFYKPCILISHSNGIGKGSGRSIAAMNLFDALSHCSDLLTDFGGHAIAAGLSINMPEFDAFAEKINKYAQSLLTEDDMIPVVKIDCPLGPKSLSIQNAKLISKLEPFGIGNERPTFSLLAARVDLVSTVGNENQHLRMKISKDNTTVNCIGFGMGKYASELKHGMLIDIAFTLEINNYMNTESVQLALKDIRVSEQ